MKSETPQLAFFGAQFNALLVGPNNRFATFDDLCKFAAGECGITGVSLPTGMLNVAKMISSQSYREEVVAHYAELGTPIIGLESHTDGQRVCMHEAVLCRFRGFAPKAIQHLGIEAHEAQAKQAMLDAITLGSLMGISRHQTFPGGRSVPVATDPWPAYAANLRIKALALLAMKWEDILVAAGRTNRVRIGFEMRHIMEDLQNWRDLVDFQSLLISDDAKRAFGWGVDVSHHEIDGDSPVEDVEKCLELGFALPGHAKQGNFDQTKPGACRRPANMPWRERAGQFRTFGIANPEHAHLFAKVIRKAHEQSDTGEFAVIEGECMALENPVQGMKVAAENLRLVFAGKDPISLSEIVPEKWEGPAFDSFAETGYTAEEVMCMRGPEIELLNQRLEMLGLPR